MRIGLKLAPRYLLPLGLGMATALGAGAGPMLQAHAAGPVAKFVMSPSPIAHSGTLAASTTVAVTLTAEDSTGTAVPAGTVLLSFTQAPAGGTATANGTPLTSTPTLYTADGSGHVALSYTTPGTLPASGKDIIKAQDKTPKPSFSSTDSYIFGKPAPTQYLWAPAPIAKPGALKKGTAVTLSVKAESSGAGVGGATIYLSLQGAGLGTATAGTSATALTSTPAAFTANASGQVPVTYTASNAATLPITGTDILVAQDAATAPKLTGSDSYSYGKAASYTLAPSPIAATGTLAANATVTVTLTVKDSSGNTVAGATVALLFSPTTGGGSASSGGTALGATAIGFTTDSSGVISITYQAPASPPTSGTDTLTAQNSTKKPTITATDTYTF